LAVTTAQTGADVLSRAANSQLYGTKAHILGRVGMALRSLWAKTISLPDRGDAAAANDLPPEYFRFPNF